MIEPVSAPDDNVPGAADLLDELDTHDWKRAGSTAGPRLGRSATRVHSPASANTTILDHLAACDTEVSDFIAAARQTPAPRADAAQPGRAGIYEHARAQAELLGDDWQECLAAMEWRHAASSALLMGDVDIIRREPCPDCRTWGLVWVASRRAAMCVNRHCAGHGAPRMWNLAELAAARTASLPHRAAN
ncbi:hypothetical protein [Streptomyces sp. NPDC001404]|uniref:hypothetical protein n=1 Tax=Streptomyces sp. NPDC001404 TaxID=3364571 RepID=UPI00369C4403